MSAVAQSAAARFKQTTNEFLRFICDIIAELHDEGLTTTGPAALALPISVIQAFDAGTLVGFFVDCHADWVKVSTQDAAFILDTVPQAYKKIPFDVNLLTVPLKKYQEFQKNGYNGSYDNEDWPITDEDISNMWKYFGSMIRTACNHIHAQRQPQYSSSGQITYTNPSYRSDIDLEKMVQVFNVTLDRV